MQAQYRDPWLAEGFESTRGFFQREFFCLSNFSSFQVEYKGYLYTTSEEAYQALSFEGTAPDVVEEIKRSRSAYDAQKIAHQNLDRRRPDWDDVKVSIMEEIVRCKLEQHPYIRKKLLETLPYPIVEDSPFDSFWGIGPQRDGENMLGRIWMTLRNELVMARSSNHIPS